MNKDPSSVTAQSGIDSKKPTSSMMLTILLGSSVADKADNPDESMIVETIPWATRNSIVMISIPQVTAACAKIKRIKHLNATSGFLISAKLPQVFTTPMTKNSTSSA